MRKGIVTTNPLFWMPFDIDLWLGQLAGGLRADQKGALMDLLMTSLRQNPPCTLQNDPAYLAARSGLGRDWSKLSGPILKNFEPITIEGEERLICPWLRKVYDEQLSKYQNRSTANRGNRGKRDGQADEGTNRSTNRGTNRTDPDTPPPHVTGTNAGTNRTTNGDDPGTNRTPEVRGTENPKGFSSTDLALRESAPAALGLVGRAAAGKEMDDPYRAADASVNSESARLDAEARALADEYATELFASVERWRQAHEKEFAEHRIAEIKALGLFGRQLTPKDELAIEAGVARRVCKAEGWPGRATWTANRQRKMAGDRLAVPA
jgi:hypothetical protein